MKGGYFSFSVQRNIFWENNMKKEKVTSMIVVGFLVESMCGEDKIKMD